MAPYKDARDDKEGSILINVTFKLMLEDTFSPLGACAVRMTK